MQPASTRPLRRPRPRMLENTGERFQNAHADLRRRLAPAISAARAAHVRRLRGERLLPGGDDQSEPARLRGDQIPAAHPGRRRAALDRDHVTRATCVAASRHRAGRASRHAACRRRNPCSARRQRHGHSVLPLHHVGRVDRGRRGGDRQAVLVPALCDARPRVHHQADRARGRRELQRAGPHRGPAGARAAPS